MTMPGFLRSRRSTEFELSSQSLLPSSMEEHSKGSYSWSRFWVPVRRLSYSLRRWSRWRFSWVVLLLLALGLESFYHTRPMLKPLNEPLDEPFYTTCQEPPGAAASKANATLLMLARNSDVDGAVKAVKSVEAKFNHWAHYPITFMNDKPFNRRFKEALTAASSGHATFIEVPSSMWGFPSNMDTGVARAAIAAQGARRLPYAGLESYHHMCRFNSGFFFDIPELQRYKWYWRIEPDVRFTCDITYDPFVEMERRGKKYGYAIALWEVGGTVPSLYRKVSDYKVRHKLPTTRLWNALLEPNPAPYPIRKIMAWTLPNRDSTGDIWNVCHFWSNFEIADMDWYRSPGYRELFSFLDNDGGFYMERWGDAPVHTLAAALLLKDTEIHHFRDWGYSHPPFQYIPIVPRDGSRDLNLIRDEATLNWQEHNMLAGCRCEVDFNEARVIDPTCANTLRKAFE